jgi:hypothetical protein
MKHNRPYQTLKINCFICHDEIMQPVDSNAIPGVKEILLELSGKLND